MVHAKLIVIFFVALMTGCAKCAKCPTESALSAADMHNDTPLPATHEKSVALLLDTLKLNVVYERAIQMALGEQLKINPQLALVKDVMEEFFRKYMGWEAIKAEFTKLYMEAFTKDEVDEMIRFYQSPVGQKAAELSPELMEKGGEIGRKMVEAHLPELKQMIADKLGQSGEGNI